MAGTPLMPLSVQMCASIYIGKGSHYKAIFILKFSGFILNMVLFYWLKGINVDSLSLQLDLSILAGFSVVSF